jgi:uncharacterized protein DUF3857/transglutaminase superfamily protein
MYNSTLLRGAALILAALSPALVSAQFQQPTDDELKMTADPKAPGAAAVYLNISEIANDPMHYQSYYCRIKILSEKAKDVAKIEVPYIKGDWKVTDIKGRTIHSDGTVIPLAVKPEDLLTEQKGETQRRQMVFTLPSVEVGSILEYTYTLRYQDNEYSSPIWQVQRKYFVHSGHYQFTPFKAFMPTGTPDTSTSTYLVDERGRVVNTLVWWNRLPAGTAMKTSINGSYTIDVTDVPAIPDEDWMPPIESLLYKVQFYYMPASTPTEFWINEGKFWSKDVDKFAEPSKAIKDAVAGIVAPGDSDLVKAQKLYAAVEALDNTDYSRKKSESEMKQLKIKQAKHAEDTWAQKSGSSEDIAMLYLAMLRAAGVTAYANKVVDRDQGVFDPSYMTLSQLDTTLVIVSAGGKELILDPGEKLCPFETVNWRHSETRGLSQSAQGLSIATTPSQSYKENTTSRIGDVTVDAHGGVTGTFNIVMTGQAALRWRQAALRMDDDQLKKDFDEGLEKIVPEGVEAHIDHFLAIDTPDANLIAMIKVEGTLGTATAKRLMLPGLFFDTHEHQPFVDEEKRLEPVDMHFAERVSDQVTYHLPPGMTVEGAPQDSNVAWPAHAVFVIKSRSDSGQIIIADSLANAFAQVKAEEYQDLRSFYQKVAAAAQQELVLTTAQTASAGKSN